MKEASYFTGRPIKKPAIIPLKRKKSLSKEERLKLIGIL